MWRGWGEEEKREKEKQGVGGGVVSYELAAGGMPGLWGGEEEEEEEEEERGRGGSLTSARLEPQWLARIQPHSAFDEGWILKLNQSHMSPTERERETERPERLGEGDRGGGRDGETEGGMEDRKGEKRQETVYGIEQEARRRSRKPTSGYG